MSTAREAVSNVKEVEAHAIKVELVEAITRRLDGDPRSPADQFGVVAVALSEVLADVTFAAAQDEKHGDHLLDICLALIRRRWRDLASKELKSETPTQ